MKTKFRITTSAYNQIISTVGSLPAESGGILVGRPDDNIIRYFLFDKWAKVSSSTYTFHTEFLNPELERLYKKYGYETLGMLHSHPTGYEVLSPPDRAYFSDIIKEYDDEFLYTPLVMSAKDDKLKFIPYVFHKDGTVEEGILEILPDDYEDNGNITEDVNPIAKESDLESKSTPEVSEEEKANDTEDSDSDNTNSQDDKGDETSDEKNTPSVVSGKDVIENTTIRAEKLLFPLLKPITVYLTILMCSLWTALLGLFLSLTPSLHIYFSNLLKP